MRSVSGGGEARRLFRDVVAVRHERPLARDDAPDSGRVRTLDVLRSSVRGAAGRAAITSTS